MKIDEPKPIKKSQPHHIQPAPEHKTIHQSQIHKANKVSSTESKTSSRTHDEYVGKPIGPDEKKLDVPLVKQDRAQCGSTSLAMIFDYWNKKDPANKDYSKDEIAREANPMDNFLPDSSHTLGPVNLKTDKAGIEINVNGKQVTNVGGQATVALANYAREHGYAVSVINNASQDKLKKAIDNGIPPMISVDISGDGKIDHDVVVTGYRTTEDGKREWIINNPWGQEETWSSNKLEGMWKNHGLQDAGIGHQMLLVAPHNQKDKLLPSNFSGEGGDIASTGAFDILTAAKNKDAGTLAKAGVELAGGAASSVMHLSGSVSQAAGNALDNIGQKIPPVLGPASVALQLLGKGMKVSGAITEKESALVGQGTFAIASAVKQNVNAGVATASSKFKQGQELFAHGVQTGQHLIKEGKEKIAQAADKLFSFWSSIG
ncbi:MAG: C39 family peptidase [Firmicutes bacterium]|nr:C39 family peptidase [Bacillota bacterium]